MTSHHKALSKKVGDASGVLKHLKGLARKEKKERAPFVKKFGTFDERFKKFAAFKKKINEE